MKQGTTGKKYRTVLSAIPAGQTFIFHSLHTNSAKSAMGAMNPSK